MGKKILYVTNYYLDDVVKQRHSEPYISQAGQNKGRYIMDMLRTGGNDVIVWSNAWTNSHSLKFYRGFQSEEDSSLYYSDIVGIPGLNAYVCLASSKRFLRKLVKKQKIDVIIFYNMRLENSKLALYAKKHFKIPIILQYEDGLTNDANIRGLKKLVYQNMEQEVLGQLDGAFLVNSKIQVPCPSVVIRGAIRDREKSRTEKCLPDTDHIPKLLFSSTLDRQRGIGVLLEALAYTKEDFILTITGRGEAEQQVRAQKDRRIWFLGYLDYAAYKKELEETDICLNVQLAHHEFGNFSFPSKIFEYLSAGKLVISSDVADTKEALGDTLILYGEDDPRQLAAAIDRAIAIQKNEKERQIYQNKIAAVVEQNTIDKVAERVNRLLEKVANSHSKHIQGE